MDGLIGLIDRPRPLVVTYHGYPIEEALATGTVKAGTLQLKPFQWLEGMVLRRADAITVVGGKQKEWLVHRKGVEEDKVFVVPNGVDVQRCRPDEDMRGTDTSSNRG
jgi:glycosyltransferase involved in cell wall biosynthesis